MQKPQLLLIFLIMALISCKTKEPIKNRALQQTSYLKFDIKKEYLLGAQMNFTITNVSCSEVILYSPTIPIIQKLEDGGKWRTVRIRLCPCDAPCNAPPEKMTLLPNKNVKLKWNQHESYCGKRDEAGIRETIRKQVKKGIYRLAVRITVENKKEMIYNEFNIN